VPLGWYLGSHLFVRTTLIEVALGFEAVDGDAQGGTALLSGAVQGADEFHFGQGDAELVETDDGRIILRFSDFSILNGPDLHVYLSPNADGYTDGAVDLGALKATDGSFSYEVPPDVDFSEVRSVVIWCVPFGVQFAHAPLLAPSD